MIRSAVVVVIAGLALAGCGHERSAPAEGAKGAGEAAAPPAAAPQTQSASPQASAGWSLPVPDLGYGAREGRAIFRHYCATCHGEAGHGDGFNAYNLDPKPRDLADPAFQAKRSDADLLAVIRSGGGAAGLSTGMPPWGRTLNDREIRNIVLYLRLLPAPSE